MISSRTGWLAGCTAGLAVALAGVAPPASGEQAERRPRDRAPLRDRAEPTAEGMRAHLTREIARSEEHQRVLQQALDKLDQGEEPQAVRRSLVERSRDGGPGERRPISNQEALDVLSELNSWMHRRLERLAEGNPERFERQLDLIRPRLQPMAELRRNDPERWGIRVQMFKSEQRSRRLAREVVELTDEESREGSMKLLRETVTEVRLLRQQMHELEIERAEARIARQRERLGASKANLPAEVEKEMRELIRRAEAGELGRDDQPRRRQRPTGDRQPDL